MNDIINLLEPYKDYFLTVFSLFLLIKFVSFIYRIFIDDFDYNTNRLQSDDNYIDIKNHVIKLNGDFFNFNDSFFLDESKHLGGD